MTRAVGNGMIKTLANAIGTGAVGKLAKQVAGLSTDIANIKTPDKGSGLMFNPDTGKLYIPCGNGVTVNKNTGMLEVPIGEHLRYTGNGLDVPNADETTAGVVKLTHEVSNRDGGEWAITTDGVYEYCPAKGMAVELPAENLSLLTPPEGFVHQGGFVTCTKNRVLCTTGTVWYTGNKPIGTDLNELRWTNKTGIDIPIILEYCGNLNMYGTRITANGLIDASGVKDESGDVRVLIPPMIFPYKIKE